MFRAAFWMWGILTAHICFVQSECVLLIDFGILGGTSISASPAQFQSLRTRQETGGERVTTPPTPLRQNVFD
jgi:hypothetical protein